MSATHLPTQVTHVRRRPRREVSLTQFLHFLAAGNALQRQTRAKRIRAQNERPYHPQRDSYKTIRERLQVAHGMRVELPTDIHPGKTEHYKELVAGHNRFVGRQELVPRMVKRKVWAGEGLTVHVNPEVAYGVDGRTVYFKLILTARGPTRAQTAVAYQMLHEMLVEDPQVEEVAILQVRKGSVLAPPSELPTSELASLLRAEARYLADLL